MGLQSVHTQNVFLISPVSKTRTDELEVLSSYCIICYIPVCVFVFVCESVGVCLSQVLPSRGHTSMTGGIGESGEEEVNRKFLHVNKNSSVFKIIF